MTVRPHLNGNPTPSLWEFNFSVYGVIVANVSPNQHLITLDSGANKCVFSNKEYFTQLYNMRKPICLTDAGNNTHQCTLAGDITLNVRDSEDIIRTINLKHCIYCPSLMGNFIDTTYLRVKLGWQCQGDSTSMNWKQPETSINLEVGDVPQAFLQSPLQRLKNVQHIYKYVDV